MGFVEPRTRRSRTTNEMDGDEDAHDPHKASDWQPPPTGKDAMESMVDGRRARLDRIVVVWWSGSAMSDDFRSDCEDGDVVQVML